MDSTAVAVLKIVAEVLLGIGGLSGLAAVLVSRRKSNAEARQIEAKMPTDAAASLIDSSSDVINQYKALLETYKKDTDLKISNLCGEVDGLKLTINRYGKRVAYLMTGIQLLTEQLVSVGHDPCWTPNAWNPEDPGKLKE